MEYSHEACRTSIALSVLFLFFLFCYSAYFISLYSIKVKVKVIKEQAMKAQKGSRSIVLLFNLGARYGGWSTPRPGRLTSGKETRCPLYRRMGGPQGRSGRVRKISPPTGIRSPDRPAHSESLYRLSYRGFLYSIKIKLHY